MVLNGGEATITEGKRARILFLAWQSPWPAHSGASLRGLGILKELALRFDVELLLLLRNEASPTQLEFLGKYARTITTMALKDRTLLEKIIPLFYMVRYLVPYHSGVLLASFRSKGRMREYIRNFNGYIFTSTGHWATLMNHSGAKRWIINQNDADIDLWRVYVGLTRNPVLRAMSSVNYFLARRLYPKLYTNAGCVISVCAEDCDLTIKAAPQATVHVIENGVDCSHFAPTIPRPRVVRTLLFTGTSAWRNMIALRYFLQEIFPIVRREVSGIRLVVGGNFSESSQAEFRENPDVSFTGRVDDMRPVFDSCDIFVAPFRDSHGSKLKIAEAMAMAMPIVATREGVRGFDLRDEESVLIGRDSKHFADQIVRLISDVDLQKKIGESARVVALMTLDWHLLGERLATIVSSLGGAKRDGA